MAGDSAQAVFDNATAYLAERLEEAGAPARRLAASTGAVAAGAEPASRAGVIDRISAMKPRPGEACFVFLTSHGDSRRGLFLSRANEYLTPADLDAALEAGCGAAPTVAIVSGCYSGAFAAPPMARPNRLILTAARADRPSFGCGASFTYTVFDQCLLAALEGARSWPEAIAATNSCVGARERLLGERPSEPQAYLGPAAATLPMPWPAAAPVGMPRFVAGPDRFSPEKVPMPPAVRDRRRQELEAYAAAPDPKALALSPEGQLVWAEARGDARRGPADLRRQVLEVCEWMNALCALYAVDDAVQARLRSGLLPLQPPLLARAGPVTPASIPFLPLAERERIGREYLALAGPKALAASLSGRAASVARAKTAAAAREAALVDCRGQGEDCLLVAADNSFALGFREGRRMRALGKN